MAKIVEEVVVVKLSHLVKDNQDAQSSFVSAEMLEALEAVVSELVGEGCVVDIATQ